MVELGKILNETKIIPTNMRMSIGNLYSFVINETQYTVNQHIELTKQITQNMEIDNPCL